ncbi:hypothetical protein ACQCVK_04340 [Rossellomorea vietnamensis]|uniref:hypothetical protein n=1 Tax=Rossellomorea vietnamensis TaxID=218284 RepID=UPI003CED4B88
MKKVIFAFITVSILLSACSEDVAEVNEIKKAHEELRNNPELAEENFLSETIEATVEIDNNLDELELLLNEMSIEDPSWKMDISLIAMSFSTSWNTFIINRDFLTSEQRNKYTDTLENYLKFMEDVDLLGEDLSAAMETYDERELLNIKNQIASLKTNLQISKEKLDIERYE